MASASERTADLSEPELLEDAQKLSSQLFRLSHELLEHAGRLWNLAAALVARKETSMFQTR